MSGDGSTIGSQHRGKRELALTDPDFEVNGSEGSFFPENQRSAILEFIHSDRPSPNKSEQKIETSPPAIEHPLNYRELLDYLITHGPTNSPIPYQDCVYGRQWITPVEQKLICTAPFLRLDDVSQMTAQFTERSKNLDYSRLEHSISAMFAGEYCGRRFEFDDKTVQVLRIMCLSHDLGHAPFSHLVENLHGRRRGAGFDHEDVVLERLSHPVVSKILNEIGITPKEISVMLKDKKNPLAFIESELCDRIQYLLDGSQRSDFSTEFKSKIHSCLQRYTDSHIFTPDGNRVCIMGDRLNAALELTASRNAWLAEGAYSGDTTLVNTILVEELLRIFTERAEELRLDQREIDQALEDGDMHATYMCSEEDVIPEFSHEVRSMLASCDVDAHYRPLIGIRLSDLNEHGRKILTTLGADKELDELKRYIKELFRLTGADEFLHGAILGQTRLEPKIFTFKSFHPVESLPSPGDTDAFNNAVKELESKLREDHQRIQADFYIPDRGNPSFPSLKIDASKVVTIFAGTRMPDGSRLEHDIKGYIGDCMIDGTVGPGQSTFFIAARKDLPIEIQDELQYRLKHRLARYMRDPSITDVTMHRNVFGPTVPDRYSNHTQWNS